MPTVTLKGNPIEISGNLPPVGRKAPAFRLTDASLNDVTLADFTGKKKVLSIVPSLDTGVCATSTRKFNERAAGKPNTVVLVVSGDLPFAQKRFCTAEGLQNVTTLSMMRDRDFAKDYGVLITSGPLAGLAARAVVTLGEDDVVRHAQLVPEIGQEPDYDAALASLEG